MKKNKFDIIYENIINSFNNTNNDINEKTYKSFEEFRQFCKQLDLIVELDKNLNKSDKLIEASLYFMKEKDNDNKPIRFDYLDQLNNSYIKEYNNLFKELKDYKNKYIVTLTGKKDSPQVIWG